jgi:hypothetical protein
MGLIWMMQLLLEKIYLPIGRIPLRLAGALSLWAYQSIYGSVSSSALPLVSLAMYWSRINTSWVRRPYLSCLQKACLGLFLNYNN